MGAVEQPVGAQRDLVGGLRAAAASEHGGSDECSQQLAA